MDENTKGSYALRAPTKAEILDGYADLYVAQILESGIPPTHHLDDLAKDAYRFATAMMAEREKAHASLTK